MMDMIDTDKVYKQLDDSGMKNGPKLVIKLMCRMLDCGCPECLGNYDDCNVCFIRQQLIKLCKEYSVDVVLRDVIVDE